ncbi:predicted protein [Postia placenta Mad-698-R]|nr:predicted protein [Postia placenta Mad-698-R]
MWLPVKAKFTHSTPRISSTSTSQTALRPSSTVASSSRAQIGHPDQLRRTTLVTRRSDERNIRSVLEAPLHLDPPRDTLALSPLPPAFLKLSSPAQVKRKEISLQTLCQSLSLRRMTVKKESWSPSPWILLGPPRRQRSPPRQQSLTGRPPQPPPPPQRPLSPPTPIMSSPAAIPDKETLKLLLPLQYDSKTVIECNRFLSQLRIYWLVNTSLTTIELKVQVALSLLDGDACAWATPYFAQLASVQVGVQGATTPFANEAAFAAAFRARFGNLDDKAAAQVELAKLCTNKSVREKRTAAEFSALFKGPADRSGYGDLELRDKYLSGIPSRVYRKIELETFTTWQAAEKRATEVEQILDISRAQPRSSSRQDALSAPMSISESGVRGCAWVSSGVSGCLAVSVVGEGRKPIMAILCTSSGSDARSGSARGAPARDAEVLPPDSSVPSPAAAFHSSSSACVSAVPGVAARGGCGSVCEDKGGLARGEDRGGGGSTDISGRYQSLQGIRFASTTEQAEQNRRRGLRRSERAESEGYNTSIDVSYAARNLVYPDDTHSKPTITYCLLPNCTSPVILNSVRHRTIHLILFTITDALHGLRLFTGARTAAAGSRYM